MRYHCGGGQQFVNAQVIATGCHPQCTLLQVCAQLYNLVRGHNQISMVDHLAGNSSE